MSLMSISYDLPNLLLCVKEGSVRFVTTHFSQLHIRVFRTWSSSSNGGQTWVFLYLDTPSLIVSEVPMKVIHLIVRHEIEQSFNLRNAKEVASYVQHEATISKAWTVRNAHARKCEGCLLHLLTGSEGWWQELFNGLESIEKARCSRCLNRNITLRDMELITFCALSSRVDEMDKRVLKILRNLELAVSHLLVMGSEVLGFSQDSIWKLLTTYRERGGQTQCSTRRNDFARLRNESDGLLRTHSTTESNDYQ